MANSGLLAMRLPDWPERLAGVFAARMAEPFSRGGNDCCMFAAACIEAVTGVNPAARFKAYSTTAEAEAIIARSGGLYALVSSVLGQPIPKAMAWRGDVALIEIGGVEFVAVIDGEKWLCPGPDGMRRGLVKDARAVWRV